MPTGESNSAAAAAAGTPKRAPGVEGQQRKRPLKLRVHSVVHWLHVYISMFSLLMTLFFALTGITLNHPSWVFGSAESKQQLKGTFPAGWTKGPAVDWLKVTEYLRKENGVRGFVDDHQADESEGSVNFKAPGYSAECFFKSQTGAYNLTIEADGIVAVMNDFHRGQNTGKAWSWVIDVAGATLAFVALTGLVLLFYLKKVRVKALIGLMVGAAIIIILMKLAA